MVQSVGRRSGALIIGAVLCACALILTGCSGSDATASSSPDSSTAYPGSTAIRAALDAGYAGTSQDPPSTGPTPAKDKTVWILSATQQVYGLVKLTEEVGAAASALGWKSKVCDGLNNAGGGWANCVRQATSAGADAIVLLSIDCAPVKAPLEEARAAGIAIVSLTSFDCDDPTQGGSTPLFDVGISFLPDVTTPAEFFEAMGRLRAQWIINQTGGHAKVLQVFFDGVSFGSYLAKGFEEELKTCKGCSIVSSLAIAPTDIGNIRHKFETALIQASDANAVSVDVDFMFSAGFQQTLVTSDRKGLVVAGGECGLDNLGYIRSGGGQQMCIGQSLGHMSYAAMDELNRFWAGEKPGTEGLGWQLIDATHNLPPKGKDYDGSIDYRSAYAAIWR